MSEKKKISFFDFMRSVKEEVHKITWATRQTTLSATYLIIIVSIFTAIFFFVVDQFVMGVLRLIFGLVE